MPALEIWLKGLIAAAIAGAANGVITGFAAVGIDPAHFNLGTGLGATLSIAGVSALMSAIIGSAAYLKQSPLPGEWAGVGDRDAGDFDRDRDRRDPDHHDADRDHRGM